MSTAGATLTVVQAQGTKRWGLAGRPLSGGDIVQLCCSGGWLMGRFEWHGDVATPPSFHFSIELAGGAVAQQTIVLPEGAILRWP